MDGPYCSSGRVEPSRKCSGEKKGTEGDLGRGTATADLSHLKMGEAARFGWANYPESSGIQREKQGDKYRGGKADALVVREPQGAGQRGCKVRRRR